MKSAAYSLRLALIMRQVLCPYEKNSLQYIMASTCASVPQSETSPPYSLRANLVLLSQSNGQPLSFCPNDNSRLQSKGQHLCVCPLE